MRSRAMLGGAAALTLVMAAHTGVADAQARKFPYFASISASAALMRTGPGRNFPAKWRYQRSDLPIRIIDSYKDWRKVEDPDGEQGWMLGRLLSDTQTGIVTGMTADLLQAPRFGAPLSWRAAVGVVGRVSKCADGWCLFDVHGRRGYIEANRLWGSGAGETAN